MKRVGMFALLLLAGSAFAEEPRTITLGVEHMTCAACSFTVRKALSHVTGVTQSTVNMEAHTATVTFDSGKTTPEALATTVSQAGFPAKVLHNGS